MEKYITYLRVSAKTQGISGLGIDAQIRAVKNFLDLRGVSEPLMQYTEVETGKSADRKELRKAINKCKETGSKLVIAKLDRLARNVVFTFMLRDELQAAGVEFIALDIPDMNTLTLGIFATMAQHERETISQRTVAGLESIKQIIKKQGFYIGKKSGRRLEKLGNPRLEETAMKGCLASATVRRARKLKDTNFRQTYELASLLAEKGMLKKDIAVRLNKSGYKTPRGYAFVGATVSRLLIEGRKMKKVMK